MCTVLLCPTFAQKQHMQTNSPLSDEKLAPTLPHKMRLVLKLIGNEFLASLADALLTCHAIFPPLVGEQRLRDEPKERLRGRLGTFGSL